MSKMVRRQQKLKQALLAALEKSIFVEGACKRAGIPRSTVYRWLQNDQKFHNQVEEKLQISRSSVCDSAEAQIVSSMKNGNLQAAIFLFKMYSPRFTKTQPNITNIYQISQNLTTKELALIEQTLDKNNLLSKDEK